VTPDEKVDLVRSAAEQAMTEGPSMLLDRYDELFTEDFRWRPSLQASVEGEREYQGRAGFAQYWDDFQAGFKSVGFRNASFRAIGEDTVLGQVRLAVEGAESGVPVEHDIGWVFRFDGDKIASGDAYMSWAEAEAAAHA
jgi:ketosteroid isomerase-like protein